MASPYTRSDACNIMNRPRAHDRDKYDLARVARRSIMIKAMSMHQVRIEMWDNVHLCLTSVDCM